MMIGTVKKNTKLPQNPTNYELHIQIYKQEQERQNRDVKV